MRATAVLLLVLLPSCSFIEDQVAARAKQYWENKGKEQVEVLLTKELTQRVPELVKALDTNKDDRVSFAEIGGIDFKDPVTLGMIISAILGLLGLRKAVRADNNAELQRIRSETDELWDKTTVSAIQHLSPGTTPIR